jgi:hypothetical protein
MKKLLAGLAAALLLIGALVTWPYIYNYHLFSLAQLKNSIEIGDDYVLVSKKFQDYQQEHKGASDLQVLIKADRLFIYHVNSFDDCQLTVNFDTNNKVNSIAYIGD